MATDNQEPQPGGAPEPGGGRPRPSSGTPLQIDWETRRRRYLPLLYRVAAINALLLLAAVAVTIVILVPGHESSYRIDEEGVAVIVAVVLVLLLNLLLLRKVVRPLQRLTMLARTVDLAKPSPVPDAKDNSEAGELAQSFNDMLARLSAERRDATGRVLAGQEAERLRIAQELHDQVGQELTAVLLLLSRLQTRVPEEVRSAVLEAQSSVRASLEDVRRIAVELRPEALDDLGLESALSVLRDRFAERSGLNVLCQIADGLPKLAPDAEVVIYRIAQEALTNVARHSGSKTAELSLRRDDGEMLLSVLDNGKGLDTDQPGSGIRGMRERAALVGATLEIRNRDPDPGTEVLLRVPLSTSV